MRYQVTTRLTPREALEQALADFGPGGLGLQILSQTNLSLGFQGGGGYIADGLPGAKTTLELRPVSGICCAALHNLGPWRCPEAALVASQRAHTSRPASGTILDDSGIRRKFDMGTTPSASR
jgi:hypothetical protein